MRGGRPSGLLLQVTLGFWLLSPARGTRARSADPDPLRCSPACGRGGLCLPSSSLAGWRCFCRAPWRGGTCEELAGAAQPGGLVVGKLGAAYRGWQDNAEISWPWLRPSQPPPMGQAANSWLASEPRPWLQLSRSAPRSAPPQAPLQGPPGLFVGRQQPPPEQPEGALAVLERLGRRIAALGRAVASGGVAALLQPAAALLGARAEAADASPSRFGRGASRSEDALRFQVYEALCPEVPCPLGLTLDDVLFVKGAGSAMGIEVEPAAGEVLRASVVAQLRRQLAVASSPLRLAGAGSISGFGASPNGVIVWFPQPMQGRMAFEQEDQEQLPFDNFSNPMNDTTTKPDLTALAGRASNKEGDLEKFLMSLFVNVAVIVGCLIAFSVLRLQYKQVYQERLFPERMKNIKDQKEKKPEIADRYFAWFGPARSLQPEEVERIATLDHAMYIEFIILAERLMLAIGIPFTLILVPQHLCCGGGKAQAIGDHLSMQGLNNVADGNYLWWVHAFFTFYVTGITIFMVFKAQEDFVQKRMAWLKKMSHVRATTLLIQGLPDGTTDVTDEAERKIADLEECLKLRATKSKDGSGADKVEEPRKLNDPDTLARFLNNNIFEGRAATRAEDIHMVKKESGIRKLRATLAKLEEDRARLDALKSGNQPFIPSFKWSKLKKLDTSRDSKEELERRITKLERRAFNQRGDLNRDPSKNSTSAFIRFQLRRDAVMMQKLFSADDFEDFEASIPPVSEDIIWDDLAKDETTQATQYRVGLALVGGVFMVFAPAVLGTVAIAQWASLAEWMPWFGLNEPWLQPVGKIWDGVAGTTILTIFMGLIPQIFMFIFDDFFVMIDKQKAQFQLQKLYYFFLIVFVMFLSAIGNSLLETTVDILLHPVEFFFLLANVLPPQTHFFLNYFHSQWMVLALSMLRMPQFAKFMFFKKIYNEEEAKKLAEPEDQGSQGIGARSALSTMNLTIALTLCNISPIVTWLAFVYFAINRVVHTYLFSYAETVKGDLGGQCFVEQCYETLYALFLYVAFMTGLIYRRTGENVVAAAIVFVNFYVIYEAFKKFYELYRWEFLDLGQMELLKDELDQDEHYDMEGYKQPELHQHGVENDSEGSVAKGGPVCDGVRMKVVQDIIRWRDVNSWEAIGRLSQDQTVVAGGFAVERNGFWMVPLQDGGAVEMDYLYFHT